MPRSHALDRDELLARQSFQLDLVERLRGLDDPQAIMAMASRMLGESTGVTRCGYAEIAPDGQTVCIERDWAALGAPSMAGVVLKIEQFGTALMQELRAGNTSVVDDCAADPRTAPFIKAWASIGAGALIVCPFLREEKLSSVLFVHADARHWTEAEIARTEDVALRTAEAVDRARAEAALKASELRYRTLFNSLDAGFCVVEVAFGERGEPLDYRFLEVNDAFPTYTGIQNAAGRWMREIAPDHEQHWFDAYGAVAKSGVPARFELPAHALGDRWYMVHAYRVDDPALNHVAILFTDLTQRRKTERALEESREELELAARAAQLGRFDYRPQEGTLRWDTRCKALFGLSPDARISYQGSFLAGLHPEDRDRADRAVTESLDPRGNHRYDIEYRTIGIEDGVERHIEAHGLAFFEGALPTRLIGTVQDVSERRRADALLAETEERLRMAGKATNDAVWDWDFRSGIVLWNAALERAYGHRPELVEPTGRWWLDHIHPDDRDRVYESIHGVIDGRETVWTDEYRFRCADGRYADVLDRGYVIRDAAGAATRMVGAMLDMSVQKSLERQLREQNVGLEAEVATTAADLGRVEDALRQAQKMEAVGQLTGGLAHDFNNLLAGISGALEMMQLRIGQGRVGDLERYATAAQGAVRRAAALTHRLLAFSRRQTLDPRPTDVNRLVAGIEELIRRTAGPGIIVETVGQAGLWTTMVDPNQLENALLNLCINARDAMPDGGRITIETANKWLDDRAGRERGLVAGQYVSLCVTDTGTGMTEEVAERAFDPFFTTKPIGEGTGLGLSMIYGFARQSGGQVRIYTELGQGTTMCIYLPRHLGAPEDATLPSTAGIVEPHGASGRTILVVDDEPTVRMLAAEVVGELGHAVLEAGDGSSALAILEGGARIDLLVTDVGLPGGMNGRQLADRARVLLPGLKVVFITGYAESAVITGQQLGTDMALITKPFAMDTLASRVTALLG
ncbi:PAS domain S-box-containing protein [Sphingomonas zeicaulis]|uniref:PAS domain-containing protein n=1 Tax=Sphingomonas zeicaulis TaxID=1632740 RepID=UPI003D1D1F46